MDTRRKFDEDFKHGAVRIVRETSKPIAQVARDLGINEGTLGNWCAKDRRSREGADGAALSESERAELARYAARTRSWRCSVMCSSARWPSGCRRRWAAGERGHVHRCPEGGAPIPHATACRALGVSQAWFYKWAHGDASAQHARREQLTVAIRRLFAQRGRYGSPRITADLREEGWQVSLTTVAQIMAEQRLRARPPRRRRGLTRAGRGRWRAPDLVGRDFAASKLNQKWYGDGTEIPTDEGTLYLDSVLDMGSRRILGFAMSEHHHTDCAYGALRMAVAVRGGAETITGVILHTDQGSEYTAGRFRTASQRIGIRQSMGRPGSALDNAVIESWHSTVEFELRRLEHFTTRAQARAALAAWIEDYNQTRRHSGLQMNSPIDYELRHPWDAA